MSAPLATAHAIVAAVPNTRSVGVAFACYFRDETFTARPHHQRISKIANRLGLVQQLQVVLDGFSETDAWVYKDIGRIDTRVLRIPGTVAKKFANVRDDVPINRICLHGERSAEHVHQDDGNSLVRNDREHFRITHACGDVIHNICAGIYRCQRNCCPGCVDGNGNRQFVANSGDHRNHAANLFVVRNW